MNIIHNTALKMAQRMSTKKNALLLNNENSLKELIKKLLNCENPFIGIDKAPCVIHIEPNNFFD